MYTFLSEYQLLRSIKPRVGSWKSAHVHSTQPQDVEVYLLLCIAKLTPLSIVISIVPRRSETHFFVCILLLCGFSHDLHLRGVILIMRYSQFVLTILPQTEFAVIFLPTTLVPIIQKLSVRTRWDDVGNGHSVACGVGYCWLSHASDSHISRVARPVRRATPEMNPYCPSVDGFSLRILNFRIHPS